MKRGIRPKQHLSYDWWNHGLFSEDKAWLFGFRFGINKYFLNVQAHVGLKTYELRWIFNP